MEDGINREYDDVDIRCQNIEETSLSLNERYRIMKIFIEVGITRMGKR